MFVSLMSEGENVHMRYVLERDVSLRYVCVLDVCVWDI